MWWNDAKELTSVKRYKNSVSPLERKAPIRVSFPEGASLPPTYACLPCAIYLVLCVHGDTWYVINSLCSEQYASYFLLSAVWLVLCASIACSSCLISVMCYLYGVLVRCYLYSVLGAMYCVFGAIYSVLGATYILRGESPRLSSQKPDRPQTRGKSSMDGIP